MNYRHAYHAGCAADVLKHAVLTLLIRRMQAKEGGFSYLDTHAGLGRYDLTGVEAGKTGEWQQGIGRLWLNPAPPPILAAYLAVLRTLNPDGALVHYPGSPALVRALLRPQDRMMLCELHPDDVRVLRGHFRQDDQVAVHHRDGYEALGGLLPPAPRRGLALIDPPFERRDEWQAMAAAMAIAWKRWPTGTYALWYPIKETPLIERFRQELAGSGFRSVLDIEYRPDGRDLPDRLNGSGVLLLNPPWQIDQDLEQLLQALPMALDQPTARPRLTWLARGN